MMALVAVACRVVAGDLEALSRVPDDAAASHPAQLPRNLSKPPRDGFMALGRVELIEADKADVVVLGGSQSVTEARTGIAVE